MVDVPEEYEWSSYQFYIGNQKPPEWLYRDFVLGYFGKKVSYAQKQYQQFVTVLSDRQYESLLTDIVSSTILGTPDFITVTKDRYLSGKKADKDVPALKELSKKISMSDIFNQVESAFEKDKTLARNIKLYLCQTYTGVKLKDIGRHFGIGESGVSQASTDAYPWLPNLIARAISLHVLRTL